MTNLNGGVLQFTRAAPAITTNGAPNGLVVTNAVVAYRNVPNADIHNAGVATITFQGANTFRLNNSTNATSGQTYTFDNTLGPANYARLEMINGGTLYRGGNLTIGNGGSMLASNTAATVSGSYANNGVLTVYHSTLTFQSAAALNGTTAIDLANEAGTEAVLTATDLTLGPSSALALSGLPDIPSGTPYERVLCAYSGARTGTFGSVSGLDANWRLAYGADSNGFITLRYRPGGTLMMVR